jgi:DNA-binding MarR family transcriptional regulator
MAEQRIDSQSARALVVAGEVRAVVGRLSRRLREEAPTGDFTSSQKSVLVRLDRDGPATLATLARAEGMRSQSMGTIVAALTAAGYVNGSPDPADGRQTILSLAPAAREEIRAGRAAREDWLFRTIRATLAVDEQEALATGVELLKRLLDGPEA